MKRNVQPELRAGGGGGGIPVDAGCRPPPGYCRLMGWTVAVSHHLEVTTDPRFRHSQRAQPQYNAMRERRNVFARDFHLPRRNSQLRPSVDARIVVLGDGISLRGLSPGVVGGHRGRFPPSGIHQPGERRT